MLGDFNFAIRNRDSAAYPNSLLPRSSPHRYASGPYEEPVMRDNLLAGMVTSPDAGGFAG